MSGTHTLYLGATGPARLSVDGREVLASGRELAARDVMGVLKAGDADSVEVTLTAGDEVLIEVDFSWTPARVHGLWYGLRGPDSPEAMFDRAVAAARAADAVVLVVGETPDASVESKDRPDTLLPANQRALIAAVTAANPRTVVVANVGHAFDATPAVDAAGLLVAWYPGEGFGPALASVIAGTREPGGRLPVTLAAREADYPALSLAPDEAGHLPYTDGRLCGYRGLLAAGTAALYPFGAGQGYAAITWGEARVGSEGITLALTNGSDRAASEVVQLYRAEPEPALVGFAKVLLAPGETREVTLAPDPHLLRRWTEAGWAALPLPLALRVARHAEDAGQVVLWGGA